MINPRRIYLKRNTIASLTFESLTILCGFILPRFFLQQYGSATNGLISSITQFLGFISLCELGMGAVVPANLYRPLAEKDTILVSSIIESARKFYRLIAFILLGYIGVLIGLYPSLVNGSFDFSFTASLILIISVSSFAQYFFGITNSLLLKADQKQYIPLIINSTTLLLNTVLSVIFIMSGFSVQFVKLSSSIIFIVRPLFLNFYVRKHYKLIRRIKYVGEPIKQKWNGIAQHFAFTIQEKTDIIILTFLSTLENVSIYSVYYIVINGIRGFVYAATAGISSLIGNMIAKNETDKLKTTFYRFNWMMHTFSTYVFTVTGILIIPFVSMYTAEVKDANYVAPVFAAILCAALAARCMQMPYNIVVQAANHFKQTQLSAILEPIINIVLSVALVFNFGLIGVAIGTFVSMVYRLVYLAVYLMKNVINIKPREFTKQMLINLLNVAISFCSTYWIKLSSPTLLRWFIMAITVSVVCGIACIFTNVVFYRENMTYIIYYVLKKHKRGKNV